MDWIDMGYEFVAEMTVNLVGWLIGVQCSPLATASDGGNLNE